jgi:mannose-6-phosphate isomerase-like protein (cupin superfamily)
MRPCTDADRPLRRRRSWNIHSRATNVQLDRSAHKGLAMTADPNATDTASPDAQMQPWIVAPEDAETVRPFGIDMKIMLGAEHTGGTFSAIVAEVKPGEGPPPHLHHDREEYFYVLEGTYELSVNGNETTVGPGTLVFIPRGTVHAFKNVASTLGKVLEWTIPGSNGDYFRAVHEMEADGGFDPEKFGEINRQFVTEFVG